MTNSCVPVLPTGQHDAPPSLQHGVLPYIRHDDISYMRHGYEYLTVREAAALLQKRKSRIYAMADEGLLSEVGFDVLRTKKGRVWIGIPRCGLKQLRFISSDTGGT